MFWDPIFGTRQRRVLSRENKKEPGFRAALSRKFESAY